MPTWPASLPQNLEMEEYEETSPDTVISSSMDAGPPKSRQRFTAGIEPIAGRQLLTKAQVATLETFYRTTLKGGSLNFDWVHPRTQAAAVVRFSAPPKKQVLGPDAWFTRYQFIVMP